MREAQRGDAAGIASVSTAAVPYLVCSAARVAADLRADATFGRRRYVGLVAGVVAGTATALQVGDRHGEQEVFVGIEVHPELGSRGVGTALLGAAAGAFPGATWLSSVCLHDPVSMAFAVRNGFVPREEQAVCFVDPREVDAAGPEPAGLRAVTLDALPDLRMLLATHNLAAGTDPTGRGRRYTMYQLRAEWWDTADNAPDLSFGLLADEPSGPVLAAYTSIRADRVGGRTWCSDTATHPAYQDRGLAGWVKRRMLNAVSEAGIGEAWALREPSDPAMLAVDAQLGYRPVARSVQLRRRLGTARRN